MQTKYLLIILVNFQDLRRKEQECGNPLFLVQSNEITLSAEEYDASKSEMKLTLRPVDEHTWKSCMDKPMSVVGSNVSLLSLIELLHVNF